MCQFHWQFRSLKTALEILLPFADCSVLNYFISANLCCLAGRYVK
jgi:hypothetical protein